MRHRQQRADAIDELLLRERLGEEWRALHELDRLRIARDEEELDVGLHLSKTARELMPPPVGQEDVRDHEIDGAALLGADL